MAFILKYIICIRMDLQKKEFVDYFIEYRQSEKSVAITNKCSDIYQAAKS